MTTTTQGTLKGKVRAKSVAKYVLLPGIIPQIKELAGSGFGYFSFLIAIVYNSVRILPNNHPYLNPSNIGKFGIKQVVAAAADHIILSRKNWDQIAVFVAVLVGILLLFLQFFALIYVVFNNQAFAGPAGPSTFTSMFQTASPANDVAFMMLDFLVLAHLLAEQRLSILRCKTSFSFIM